MSIDGEIDPECVAEYDLRIADVRSISLEQFLRDLPESGEELRLESDETIEVCLKLAKLGKVVAQSRLFEYFQELYSDDN